MPDLSLPHGTAVTVLSGRPVEMVARCGTPLFQAVWDDEGPLLQARLRIPDHRHVVIRPRAAHHPVLGTCHGLALEEPDGTERDLSLFAAVDLAHPRWLPAMDRPGALPTGAGSAILNLLAHQARGPLRYRGPYPTGALFDSLLECFTVAELVADHARFTAEAEERALRAAGGEVAVDFHPAPFERWWPHPSVCVQLRDGVERAWVHGRAWSRDADGARRLRVVGDQVRVVLELGGRPWAEVARLAADGTLLDGPHPLPQAPARLMGAPLPDAIRAALVEALPPTVPEPLRPALTSVLASTPIRWGDPGPAVSAIADGAIVLHGGLLEALPSLPPPEILRHVAAAVMDPARALAARHMLARLGEPSGPL